MSAKAAVSSLLLISLFSLPSVCQESQTNAEEAASHARKGQEYLRKQRPDLAIPEFQAVVAIDPGNADALGNLGVLLFFRGDSAGAVPQLRAALRIRPELWKIQALLGLAEGQLGDDNAAREDMANSFPHLEEEKVKNQVGRSLIDSYTANGDLDKAAEVVSVLLASKPTDTFLLYTAYRLYADQADRTMLTLAMSAPGSAEMHVVIARELARHGDEAAAIANFREAVHLKPQFPGIRLELGQILYNSPDETLRAQAESEFSAALAANPHDEKAVLMLGEIAARRGDTRTAFEDDSRALNIQPNDVDACTELAKVLITMNEKEKAQQLLERAIRIDPSNYVVSYRLSTLYREQGKMDEAKQKLADYHKYKEMKDRLQKVFHDMRVDSGQRSSTDASKSN